MNDLQNKISLFQNPGIFWRALKKKNYRMTQLIEQTRILDFATLKPSNPQTLKPSNPQTLKPSNPATL
jgi:hypothetical protein